MAYFYNFPKINYFDVEVRNIILQAALIKKVFNNADAFYPYIIKDFERPDLIAYDVYGDETLDWLIYFSNDIIDPYYDWPLFGDQFNDYIEKKYGVTAYETMNDIVHYKYTGITNDSAEDIARKSWTMSKETHDIMVLYGENTSGWTPVYVYDYEMELNEAKRTIKILNKSYLSQIEKEIKDIFKA
jgi:hypothetical protein